MSPETYARLHGLRLENDAVRFQMEDDAPRFERMRNRHKNGTAPRAITAFNLFQTPQPIAARMAAMIAENVEPDARILEPSAGLGRLYYALREALPESQIDMIEQSADCIKELYQMSDDDQRTRLTAGDFLEVEPVAEFDAVCMNPPFKMGRDMKHIHHALNFLRPGGLLVSLCYDGARQNRLLAPECGTWEVLPAGSFKSEGTGAGVVLLTITKEG